MTKEAKEAEYVILKKIRPMAPGFHKYIVLSMIRGMTLKIGDKIVVYEITETKPKGEVKVSERTKVQFQ